MTLLTLLSKFWFLLVFMVSPRAFYIALGFAVGGVSTIESSHVRSYMMGVQEAYHDVSDWIMEKGSEQAPELNEQTISQTIENAKQAFEK